jgi:peptidoglycan-associated lipoprotein
MNIFKLNYLLVILVAFSIVATGCRKSPKRITPLPGATGKPGDEGLALGSGQPLDNGAGISTTSLEEFEGMNADRAALAAYTVLFDYDSSAVKSSELSKAQAVSETLKSDGTVKVLIEGHCDERGTEEYNRSLGERRALALRTELAKLGIDPSRVRTLSFGEDRPADPGHDEGAWAQNRRGEFILLRPK